MKKLKYAVVGTGALGGFYGGMLAHAGNDVHFLFHSDYDFVKKNGLKVDSILGDFHLTKINAYKSTEQMPECDVVLVCLKTTNNGILKDILPPLLHKDTCVILIQNGLGIEADLATDFPNQSIAGGLAFICSSKIGDGHIAHLDYGKITIGSFQGENIELLGQVCSDFEAAHVQAELSDNLEMSRWKKLVWNVPYNGMCVVLNTTTGQLMQNPKTSDLLHDLMLEVIGAANASGVQIGEGFARVMLDMTKTMRPYAPSMKLDYDFKRPLEIEAIYSAPLAQARKVGFDMPKVAMLEQQLHFIQDGYLK
ncbi:MAG: putative 2-dehydropantoate 2-reductase [Bacteroidales bacterium]|nr:putative 2-dehydropantoate 2-reductase [Bacteroidales bacterium]